MFVSRNTRRIDFLGVDGLSMDTPVLGHHTINLFFNKIKPYENLPPLNHPSYFHDVSESSFFKTSFNHLISCKLYASRIIL